MTKHGPDISRVFRLNRPNLKTLTKEELEHLQDSEHLTSTFKLALLHFRSEKIKVR